MARKKIGEMLVEAGVLDQSGLRAALVEQKRWGGPLGRILIDMKAVTEEQLVAALSRQLGIATVDIESMDVPRAVIELVPADLAEQYSLVPFAQPMKFLDVAMSDPTNLGMIDELRIRTQLNVRPYLAGPRAIERAIARYYGRGFAPATSPPRTHAATGELEINFDESTERPMELIRGSGAAHVAPPELPRPQGTREAEIQALQERISRLEALVARDEEVLRKVLGLLIEKGVATREEILERIR